MKIRCDLIFTTRLVAHSIRFKLVSRSPIDGVDKSRFGISDHAPFAFYPASFDVTVL